jgi:hypothetical protein
VAKKNRHRKRDVTPAVSILQNLKEKDEEEEEE